MTTESEYDWRKVGADRWRADKIGEVQRVWVLRAEDNHKVIRHVPYDIEGNQLNAGYKTLFDAMIHAEREYNETHCSDCLNKLNDPEHHCPECGDHVEDATTKCDNCGHQP